MVSYFRAKDKRIRATVAGIELSSIRLNFFLRNAALSTLERQKIYLAAPNKVKRLAK